MSILALKQEIRKVRECSKSFEMPRPKNKEELLNLSQENYNKLITKIESISQEEQEKDFPPGPMNRNIRDVLCHLHEWHQMFLDWYDKGMKGQKTQMPAEGYTWKTLPDLNRKIFEKYRDTPLSSSKQLFKNSYEKVRAIIEKHSDENLFTKKKYKWTGTTSLGAYLVSATSSHYDWAMKLLKKAKSI